MMSDDLAASRDGDDEGERLAVSPSEDPQRVSATDVRSIPSLSSTSSDDSEPDKKTRSDSDPADSESYVPPLQDPYDKALKYLEKHNILQLFQNITSGIVYNQPVDPLEYMELEIEKVQELERHRNHKIKRKTTPKALSQEGKEQAH